MEVGNYVTRKSYGNDMVFKIEHIEDKEGEEKIAYLRGAMWRLLADAPLSDLKLATDNCIVGLEKRKRDLIERQIV